MNDCIKSLEKPKDHEHQQQQLGNKGNSDLSMGILMKSCYEKTNSNFALDWNAVDQLVPGKEYARATLVRFFFISIDYMKTEVFISRSNSLKVWKHFETILCSSV